MGADMAHISGLVATGMHPSPFEHCDVVTTTTHKSLRGPRSGMIFYKYTDKIPDIKDRIDQAVFPALQGGPHNHQIGALAAQLKEVNSPEFKEYSKQVVENAKALAEALMAKGHKLATDGSDNHLVLWDLRPHGLTGSKLEKITDAVSITLNRNAVHGDASALSPGGVRIGMPAMTTRGCKVSESQQIAAFLDQCVQIAIRLQERNGQASSDILDCKSWIFLTITVHHSRHINLFFLGSHDCESWRLLAIALYLAAVVLVGTEPVICRFAQFSKWQGDDAALGECMCSNGHFAVFSHTKHKKRLEK